MTTQQERFIRTFVEGKKAELTDFSFSGIPGERTVKFTIEFRGKDRPAYIQKKDGLYILSINNRIIDGSFELRKEFLNTIPPYHGNDWVIADLIQA
jgi:hypothetical protein